MEKFKTPRILRALHFKTYRQRTNVDPEDNKFNDERIGRLKPFGGLDIRRGAREGFCPHKRQKLRHQNYQSIPWNSDDHPNESKEETKGTDSHE